MIIITLDGVISSSGRLNRFGTMHQRDPTTTRASFTSECEPQAALRIWACRFIGWHDDVIKWKHFPRYWPFVRGIHRSPVNSPHKGRGALMLPLICARISRWVNNREAGDLKRYRAHYDVIVMRILYHFPTENTNEIRELQLRQTAMIIIDSHGKGILNFWRVREAYVFQHVNLWKLTLSNRKIMAFFEGIF